jgi:hypothetical protein
MKKLGYVCAVAALFCASSVMAATLQARVVTDGDSPTANVTPGVDQVVNVYLQVQLDNGGAPTSDGLSIIGMNLKASATGGSPTLPDLCDTSAFLVLADPAYANFDRRAVGGGFSNFGLTNPSNSPNISGFSGTCDGAGGLLQIGGGENTIGNTAGGAPYPLGAVDTGLGNGGWSTVASGTVTVNISGADKVSLDLDTIFANTIDTGQNPANPPLAVTEVSSATAMGGLEISAGVTCAAADVNCDGNINALDIAAVVNPLNYQQVPPACDRTDITGDGNTNALDIAQIVNPLNYQTSTGPCSCSTGTPGVAGCP